MSERDEDLRRVQEAVNVLVEHFDAVHVFATRHEPEEEGGTASVQIGAGNWFARYGQIKEWTIKQDEFSRINARKDE
jgi:hypothetical protein